MCYKLQDSLPLSGMQYILGRMANTGVNRTQKGGGENGLLFFGVRWPPPFCAGYAGR
ncbi:hypothetical protein U27_01588 [Candidatus Vecturithrix granuli]|uniref:Uncharacterized protein n=1 Tax=Vecturithrix granuli TaxID=1499967 RepID=A0A081CAT2_VECG1|nr:hypothetical protein U27_01588 [Candidatus Vecturithrix granuli]